MPGYITAFVGLFVYSAVVNLIVARRTDGVLFPTGNWWVFMLWVMPPLDRDGDRADRLHLVAGRASGAAAQQASSLIALPIVILAYAVSERSLFGSPCWPGSSGALAWIGPAIAVRRGVTSLTRERLLGIGS